ncbi:epidermal growth factor receptor substrate 15-like 1 isoform X5 [Lates japonicus]|uniref:Epidermal growth factor receptor substrate 15-like 1 isoform X5 n=1 Tax=Lates japonicus TaxID=270547 RepID=A0AAD3R0T8_LATJO|nr:epidermal growth factor receptor substrate 15-like 1 isoform X5 [Lates japonicus]
MLIRFKSTFASSGGGCCPSRCLRCCCGWDCIPTGTAVPARPRSVKGRARAPETPGNMAALMTLSQLSSGNPAYENYYKQLDPGNTGKISAGDAAQFLKKSGLSDSTLGKIWDLADSERKGYLDKRGFFIALRLVASAQGGNDISLHNLNQNLAAPKFKDTSSPLLSVSTTAPDSQWAIRPDEKGKFEGIFESLGPVKGLLSGDKVRPVLLNSKLPLDVLGKIWDLSDVDKDGHLDKDEFTVAMHLVYRAMEKEPIPASLPASLFPPSKRKKAAGALPGAVAVLPALSGLTAGPAPLKDTLRSTPPLSSATPLSTSAVSLSPKHSFKSSSPPVVNWVVPVADRERYNDIFKQTDTDNDGLVTGTEVIEIFMQSSLSQTMLAQIWGLADTKQTGKLTREQFSLAMYLIQQKVTKGIDPPTTLTPDMIPPSERTTASAAGPSYMGLLSSLRPEPAALANMRRDSASSTGSAELTGIKELDDLSQEIAQLQREKFILEQEIREKEDSIRQQNSEVQDMQNNLDRESSSLQDLESQKQDAQERLEEMDQQRSKLEGMLNDVKQKCQEESQTISSLQSQIRSQENNLQSQEDELSRTKADLSRLQEEEAQLEQSLLSGRVQLDSIIKSLKTTQEEINQARSKLSLIQDNQKEVTKTIEQYNSTLSDINGGNFSNLPDLSEGFAEKENGGFRSASDSLKSKIAMFNNSSAKETPADPFQTEDPFKSDPFTDPFGGDPFKESDPFKGTSSEDFFKKTDKPDLFGSSDPFGRKPTPPAKPSAFSSGDPFTSKPKDSDVFGTADPFGSNSFGSKGGGFADFSQMSKKSDNPVLPSKKNVPNRPAPPYGSEHVKFGSESQQLEWAKRESEREEQERLRRLRLQEQQDLELAIALSRADMPSA